MLRLLVFALLLCALGCGSKPLTFSQDPPKCDAGQVWDAQQSKCVNK